MDAVTVEQRAERSRDRVSHRQIDKFADRRAQLANSALLTLSELGYARTSLREIAQNSEFSHGVLHYYFTDKVDLIMHCVKQYKAECVRRYDEIVSTSLTSDDLKHGFAVGLATTMCEDASMHRLWYDLRSQSLFEESFRADVGEIDQSLERMIWRIVSRYAELADASPTVTSTVAYAMFDGMFQHGLAKFISGDPTASHELTSNVEHVLGSVVFQNC